MTITLTHEKISNLKTLIHTAISSAKDITIRFVAKIIGHMVASFPAMQYGPSILSKLR